MELSTQLARMLSRIALATLILALMHAGDGRAAFPGANGKIAFESNSDGNDEIFVMNANGSGVTNLTNNPAPDSQPAVSPDGTKIAFVSERSGDFEIYVMNADGTGQTNLSNTPMAIDSQPAFSPDGSTIVFRTDRNVNNEIYVMNADGSVQTNLTNNAADEFNPAFSPDGTKIAFRTNRDANDEIYVMNANGSSQTNLTTNPATDTEPNFSPDGSRIAFRTTRDGNGEIYVMNANGSSQTNLTTTATPEFSPAFSPDGSRIAYEHQVGGDDEIFVMSATGSGQTNLTNNTAITDEKPDWQPTFDQDSDGVVNPNDNCPDVANPGQANLDGDGTGDACDADDDGDGLLDLIEIAIGSNPRAADSDGDGRRDAADACPTLVAATANGCPVIAPVVGKPTFAVKGVPRRIKARTLLASGIRPAVTPNRPVAFRFELLGPVPKLRRAKAGDLVLAERSLRRAGGTRRVRLKVARRLRRAVRRGAKLRLRITATDKDGLTSTRTRRISVR